MLKTVIIFIFLLVECDVKMYITFFFITQKLDVKKHQKHIWTQGTNIDKETFEF
ncbi:hypothetical protein C0J52_03061 [Blattella germanica]|nr:hypothetical protein C0J52_03061 [Blattella germanica]